VGGPGLAFETWVFRLGPICEKKTWATHRGDLALQSAGRDLTLEQQHRR